MRKYVVVEQKIEWSRECWSSEVEVRTGIKSIHEDRDEAFKVAKAGLYWDKYGKYYTSNNPDKHDFESFSYDEVRRYVLKEGDGSHMTEYFGHAE